MSDLGGLLGLERIIEGGDREGLLVELLLRLLGSLAGRRLLRRERVLGLAELLLKGGDLGEQLGFLGVGRGGGAFLLEDLGEH